MIECKYLFYIKAGAEAGLGHLRRSMAIASQLKKREKSIYFLVDGDRISIDLLKEKGFEAALYTKTSFDLVDPKIAIIDQKGDVSAQIRSLKAKGAKICLIDNISKARLISNIVIFPVSHFKDNLSWKGFQGKRYIGAKYFPLNEEFLKSRPIKHNTLTILITMGGSDPNKLSSKIASALRSMKEKFAAIIVLGAASKKQEIPKDDRFVTIKDSKNMAGLMARSDIAFSAFGTTLYELAYMGVPAIIISNYNKENNDIHAFAMLGSSVFLGHFKKVSNIFTINAISNLMNNKREMVQLSRNGKQLVDGKGAQRIARILHGSL